MSPNTPVVNAELDDPVFVRHYGTYVTVNGNRVSEKAFYSWLRRVMDDFSDISESKRLLNKYGTLSIV